MGEVMVVVARSPGLAEEMVDFLNERGPALGELIGWKWPETFRWWIRGDRRIGNKISSFHGMARVADQSVFKWAAMEIGRRQKAFPGLLGGGENFDARFDEAVPYVRYGDFESWPVLGPEHAHLARRDPRLKWTRVRGNGVTYDPEDVIHHVGYGHPQFMELLAESQKEAGFGPDTPHEDITPEAWDLSREIHRRKMRPFLAESLRPLRRAMTKIAREWRER